MVSKATTPVNLSRNRNTDALTLNKSSVKVQERTFPNQSDYQHTIQIEQANPSSIGYQSYFNPSDQSDSWKESDFFAGNFQSFSGSFFASPVPVQKSDHGLEFSRFAPTALAYPKFNVIGGSMVSSSTEHRCSAEKALGPLESLPGLFTPSPETEALESKKEPAMPFFDDIPGLMVSSPVEEDYVTLELYPSAGTSPKFNPCRLINFDIDSNHQLLESADVLIENFLKETLETFPVSSHNQSANWNLPPPVAVSTIQPQTKLICSPNLNFTVSADAEKPKVTLTKKPATKNKKQYSKPAVSKRKTKKPAVQILQHTLEPIYEEPEYMHLPSSQTVHMYERIEKIQLVTKKSISRNVI
ncbi:hypothetical protein HDV01_001396 [Terramyces sp. JEL0728]|nr:hypothetical protein HDV01_001396 [Terramyces sp. JEL0728]